MAVQIFAAADDFVRVCESLETARLPIADACSELVHVPLPNKQIG